MVRPLVLLALLALWLSPGASGQTNYAGSFPGGSNGLGASVTLPAFNLTDLPFTLEAWIYVVPGINDYGSIFYSRTSLPAATAPTGLFIRTTQSVAYELRSVWNNVGSTTSTGLSVPLNQWNHVALVVTNTSQTVYLNAASYTYPKATNRVNAFTGVGYMGYDPAIATRTFMGLMDEVRFWNVAKTFADFQSAAFEPLTGTENGLIAYYNFDDADPDTITDSTGHGFNGSPNGVTYAVSTVYTPQQVSNVTVMSARVANPIFAYAAPGSSRNPVTCFAVTVANQAPPAVTLQSINFNLQGTDNVTDLTVLSVFATKTFDYDNTTLVASYVVSAAASTSAIVSVPLTTGMTLPVGLAYFWVTADVSSTAKVGRAIVVGIDSIVVSDTTATTTFTTVSSSTGPTIVSYSTRFSNLTESHAVYASSFVATPLSGAVFSSFQQDAITTFGNFQYINYWNLRYHVCVARRSFSVSGAPGNTTVSFGQWEEIEFWDYTVTASRVADSHYTISMGVCPNDGTFHLSWDMHGDPLRYRVSVLGLVNGDAPWSNTSFSGVMNQLPPGVAPDQQFILTQVTYPRFVARPDGHMLFEHRYGTSGAGNNYLWVYNSTTGSWALIGQYANGLALNPTQNAYIFGAHYDPKGRLHISWCWRQTPDPLTNHDMYYGYSDDNGYTWHNSAGDLVATDDTNPMTLNTTGLLIYPVAQSRGLINQESQAVDSQGGIHILVTYLLDSQPNSAPDFWSSRTPSATPGTGAVLRHLHRLPNGTWWMQVIGPASRNRGQIAVDAQDNLYVVAPNWRIFFASASERWQVWTNLDYSNSQVGINEGHIDRQLLLQYNVLSVVFPTASQQLIVADYQAKPLPTPAPRPVLPVNTCCYQFHQPALISVALPHVSGDYVLNPGNPIVPVRSGQTCNGQQLEYWNPVSQLWQSNWTDTNGATQRSIDNIYATNTNVMVRTIQSNQRALYSLLNNTLARLTLTCNNGITSCLWMKFGDVPGLTQELERPATCTFN